MKKILLVIAALAHDIKKQGHISNGHTVREHPLYGADYVIEMQSKFPNFITKEDAEKIAGALRSHMGKWEGTREWVKDTTKELFPMPKDGFEQALQMADYVASRKYILSFQFDETGYTPSENDVVAINESKDISKMSLFELENYVIPFGKHRGKTLKEVKPTGYLDWVLKQVDFNNKDTQDIIKLYYEKLQEPVVTKTDNNSNQDKIDNLPF